MCLTGIRLNYESLTEAMDGLREGVLLELELDFDTVAPNIPKDITCWLYDKAVSRKVGVIDNRAIAVPCYDPGYTRVEKLQTISFRKQQESGNDPFGFMRHYYDVHELLKNSDVQAFIGTDAYTGTDAYKQHKQARFRGENQNIAGNEAFLLSDAETRALYADAYERSSSLYYGRKPTFEQILGDIKAWSAKL
jgi:hypothetical protein